LRCLRGRSLRMAPAGDCRGSIYRGGLQRVEIGAVMVSWQVVAQVLAKTE
jgi:hypothetical protein